MTRDTLSRQLKAGIITQERYERIITIIEEDEKSDPDGSKRKENTSYIEGLILAGMNYSRGRFGG